MKSFHILMKMINTPALLISLLFSNEMAVGVEKGRVSSDLLLADISV